MGRRRAPLKTADTPIDTLLGRPVEGSTDLHGLDARTAEVQLEAFLTRWSRSKPGGVVRVITGRGNRSQDGPVLKPRVRELLDGALARYVRRYTVEVGGGAYLIEVRPEEA
jgi:DNA-nicking Smr family endonuclease